MNKAPYRLITRNGSTVESRPFWDEEEIKKAYEAAIIQASEVMLCERLYFAGTPLEQWKKIAHYTKKEVKRA